MVAQGDVEQPHTWLVKNIAKSRAYTRKRLAHLPHDTQKATFLAKECLQWGTQLIDVCNSRPKVFASDPPKEGDQGEICAHDWCWMITYIDFPNFLPYLLDYQAMSKRLDVLYLGLRKESQSVNRVFGPTAHHAVLAWTQRIGLRFVQCCAPHVRSEALEEWRPEHERQIREENLAEIDRALDGLATLEGIEEFVTRTRSLCPADWGWEDDAIVSELSVEDGLVMRQKRPASRQAKRAASDSFTKAVAQRVRRSAQPGSNAAHGIRRPLSEESLQEWGEKFAAIRAALPGITARLNALPDSSLLDPKGDQAPAAPPPAPAQKPQTQEAETPYQRIKAAADSPVTYRELAKAIGKSERVIRDWRENPRVKKEYPELKKVPAKTASRGAGISLHKAADAFHKAGFLK